MLIELLENSEKLAENGDIDGSLALAKQVRRRHTGADSLANI